MSSATGNREALLIGARKCLEEKGYARTTARDLVAASGTNLASIGYHFGSKEALLNEAIGLGFQEWTARINAAVLATPDPSPFARTATSFVAMLDGFREYRPLLIAYVEAMAQAERSPELRKQLAANYRRCRAQIAATVRATIDQIELDHVIDISEEEAATGIEHFASFLMAVCDGFAMQWLVDPKATPTGEELIRALSGAARYALHDTGVSIDALAPQRAAPSR